MAVGVVGARQVRIIGLPTNPQRADVEAIFRPLLVGPFRHQHGFDRLEIVVSGHHRIDQLDALPGLHRVEIQPVLIVNEAGRVRSRIRLECDQVISAVTGVKAGCKLAQDWDKFLLRLGRHRPDNIGHVFVSLCEPPGPAAAVLGRDALAISLVVEGHRDDHTILTGDLEHGVHIPEIGLIRCQRIVVDPGLVPVHIRLGAVTDPHQHHLSEDKPLFRRLLQNRAGILDLILTKKLPLRRAEPEDGLALLVHKVPVVLADLDRIYRLVAGRDRPYRREKHNQQRCCHDHPPHFCTSHLAL